MGVRPLRPCSQAGLLFGAVSIVELEGVSADEWEVEPSRINVSCLPDWQGASWSSHRVRLNCPEWHQSPPCSLDTDVDSETCHHF